MRRCLILATAAFVVGSALLAAPAAAIYPPGKWRTHPLQVSYDMSFVAGAGPYAATATSTTVRGLNATSGAVLWSAPISCDPVSQVAAVGPDTFVVSCPDTVYGLRFASGEIAWSHKFGDLPGYGPTVPDNPNVVQTPPPVAPLLAGTGDQAGLVALALYYQDYSKPEPMLIVAIDAASGQLIGGYRTCPTTDVGQAALVGNGTILVACPTQGAVHGLRLDIGKVATSPQAALVPVFVQRFVPQSLLAVTGVGRVAAIVSVVTPAVSPTPASADVVGVRRVDMFSGAATNLTVVNAPTTFGTTTPLAAMTSPSNIAVSSAFTVFFGAVSPGLAVTFGANYTIPHSRSSDRCLFNALTAVPELFPGDPMAQFIACQSSGVSVNNVGYFNVFKADASGASKGDVVYPEGGFGGQPDPFRLVVDRAHNLVIVTGMNLLASWYIDATTGAASRSFFDTQSVGGAAVLGSTCVVGLGRGGGTIAFDITLPSVWSAQLQSVDQQSNTDFTVSRDGVTFVVTNPGGVQAVGPDGKLLWNTRYAFSALDVVQGFFVLGRQFVVVFVGTTAIGFDQRTGAFAFDRDMSGGRTCWGETLSGTVQPVELASGRSVLLLPPTFDGTTAGSPVCGFIFREDLVTVPVVIASPAAVTSNGDSFFLLHSSSATRLNGWTGAIEWSRPLSLAVGGQNSLRVAASSNLLYVSPTQDGGQAGVMCISVVDGQVLWNEAAFSIPTQNKQPTLIGDDVAVAFATPGNAMAATVVRTTFTSPGDVPTPTRLFTHVPPASFDSLAIGNGVLALSAGTTYGLDATNGTLRWSYTSTFSDCFAVFRGLAGFVFELECGGTTDFVSADDGTLAFFLHGTGLLPTMSGPAVVAADQWFLDGVQIPARLIAGFAAETVPLPTVAPFVLPPNYQPPTPAPIPVPEVNEKGVSPLASAAWTFAQAPRDGQTTDISSDHLVVNDTVLAANGTHLLWIDAADGRETVVIVPPCKPAYGSPNLHASPSAFLVDCGESRIFGYSADPAVGLLWNVTVPNTPPGNNAGLQVVFSVAGGRFYLVSNGAKSYFSLRTSDGSLANISAASHGTTAVSQLYPPTSGIDANAGVLTAVVDGQNVTMINTDGAVRWTRSAVIVGEAQVQAALVLTAESVVVLSHSMNTGMMLGVVSSKAADTWHTIVNFASIGTLAVPPGPDPAVAFVGDATANTVAAFDLRKQAAHLWTFDATALGFMMSSLQLSASPSCALVVGITSYISRWTPSDKSYSCLDPTTGALRFNFTESFRGDAARFFVDETLGSDTPVVTTQESTFRLNVTSSSGVQPSSETLWSVDVSTGAPVVLSRTAALGYVVVFAQYNVGLVAVYVDPPANGALFNTGGNAAFVRTGLNSVAVTDGHLLFAANVADSAAKAQVAWRAALPGTASSAGGYFSSLAWLGGNVSLIAALRKTSIVFVDAVTGETVSTLPMLNLTSRCIPQGISALPTITLVGNGSAVIASLANCGFVLSPRSTTGIVRAAFKMPNPLFDIPTATDDGSMAILATCQASSDPFQGGGSIVAVDLQASQVAWTAPANGFTSTSPTGFVFTVAQTTISARYAKTGELVWQLPMPGSPRGVAPLVALNSTTLLFVTLRDFSANPQASGLAACFRLVDTTDLANPAMGAPTCAKSPIASQGQYIAPPVVTAYGSVIVMAQGLFAVDIATGAILWEYTLNCGDSLAVNGRVATVGCAGLLMFDVVTGRRLSQTGITENQALPLLLSPPPAEAGSGLPTLVYQNGGTTAIVHPRRLGAALVPTPTVPAAPINPRPLPPNFHPPHKTPAQPAPTSNFPLAGGPLSVLQTYPPTFVDGPKILALTDTDEYFYRPSTKMVSRYNIPSKSVVWAVPGPAACNGYFNVGYGAAVGSDFFAMSCQGTLVFFSVANGSDMGSATIPGLTGDTSVFFQVLHLPSLPVVCAPFARDRSFGHFCARPGGFGYMINASLTSDTNAAPFSAIHAAGPGVAVVTFIWGEAAWFDTATGAILKRYTAPATRQTGINREICTTVSNDSTVLAFTSGDPSVPTQTWLQIVDIRSMALTANAFLNGTTAGNFGFGCSNVFRAPGDDVLTVVLSPVEFVLPVGPVTAFRVPAASPTNVTRHPFWEARPFTAAQLANSFQLGTITTGAYVVVFATNLVAVVDVATGATITRQLVSMNNEAVNAAVSIPQLGYVAYGTNQKTWIVDLAANQTVGTAIGTNPGVGYRVLSNSAGVATMLVCDLQCDEVSVSKGTWAVLGSQNMGVIGTNTKGDLLVAALSNIVSIGGLDATTGEARWTAGLAESAGLPVYVPGLDLVVSFSSQASTAWVASAANGTLLGVASIPMCELSSSQGAAQTAVASGAAVYFAGSSGCLYRLDLAAPRQPTVATLATVAGGGQPAFADGGLVLWIDSVGLLWAFDGDSGAQAWTHQLDNEGNYRVPVVYGAVVAVTRNPYEIDMLDRATGGLVRRVRENAAYTFGPLIAYNGFVWATCTTGVLRVAVAADGPAPLLVPGIASVGKKASPFNAPPAVSADGVLVYATAYGAAAIDTTSGTRLWAAALSRPQFFFGTDARRVTPFAVADGVVAGDVGFGVETRSLATGAVLSTWSGNQNSINLGTSVTVHRSPGSATSFVVATTGQVSARLLGQQATSAPVVTSAAPATAPSGTVPPPTDAPTLAPGVFRPSAGCLARTSAALPVFTRCVNDRVIAATLAAAGSATVADCGAAASQLTGCVEEFAAMLLQCPAAVDFGRQVMAAVADAQGFALCSGVSGPACATTGGKAAYCAALQLPSWVAGLGPVTLPAGYSGFPAVPSFSASTTPAPSTTTTAVPSTTSTTSTTTAPATTTTTMTTVTTTSAPTTTPPATTTQTAAPGTGTTTHASGTTTAPATTIMPAPPPATATSPAVPIGAALELHLNPGAEYPTEVALQADLQLALGLADPAPVKILPSPVGASDTVVFVFFGDNALTLTNRTLNLPVSLLKRYMDASSVRAAGVTPVPVPTPKAKTAAWAIALIAIFGAATLALAILVALKRRAIFSSGTYATADDDVHSLASGRINTGGQYERFEDRA